MSAPAPPGSPLRHRDGSTLDAVSAVHPLHGADSRSLGHVLIVQRRGRRPVIADGAFEQCPFALGVYGPELRFLWTTTSPGRGLLLVAQLTQGWGTRNTTEGKTIWCAQTLTRPLP